LSGIASRKIALGRVTLARNHRANSVRFVTSGASPVSGVVSGTIAVSGVALPRIDWASAVSSVASARNP